MYTRYERSAEQNDREKDGREIEMGGSAENRVGVKGGEEFEKNEEKKTPNVCTIKKEERGREREPSRGTSRKRRLVRTETDQGKAATSPRASLRARSPSYLSVSSSCEDIPLFQKLFSAPLGRRKHRLFL